MVTHYDLPEPGNESIKRSDALSEIIRGEIMPTGYISFARFMELALYHPTLGYYNSPQFSIGKQGDFTTAPEISPLFAECFAQQTAQIFEHLPHKNVLELGAGTGRLAHDLLLQLDRLGMLPEHYYIYEISPKLQEKQQQFLRKNCAFFSRIQWIQTLPENFMGVIIANEVLDALPVHCFHIEKNEVKERCVSWENNQFHWISTDPTSKFFLEKVENIRDLYQLPDGYESEINLNLFAFIPSIVNCLKQGVVLFADYGYGQREYYRHERKRGTLSCFYQHRTHDNPLILPGLQDITAHVDFTSVIEIAAENGCILAGYTTQAAFLFGSELVNIAKEKELSLSPAEEVNFHHAIKLLTLPTEMGERIKIMGLAKNLELTLMGFGLEDRSRDL